MLITTVDSVKLYIYPRDHNPPHFHAIYAEYEALIDIQTLKVLKGELPNKQLKRVIDWAEGKQAALLAEFVLLQNRA